MTPLPDALETVLRGLLLTAAAMASILFFVRLIGLRSLSKMTPADFIATIATGSLIAKAGGSTSWSEFAQAICAIAAVFGVQWLVSLSRRSSSRVKSVISNTPLLLVENGAVLDGALEESGMSRDELLAKLRQANVPSLAAVRAVVLETTGDVSVMSGPMPDGDLLERIRRPG